MPAASSSTTRVFFSRKPWAPTGFPAENPSAWRSAAISHLSCRGLPGSFFFALPHSFLSSRQSRSRTWRRVGAVVITSACSLEHSHQMTSTAARNVFPAAKQLATATRGLSIRARAISSCFSQSSTPRTSRANPPGSSMYSPKSALPDRRTARQTTCPCRQVVEASDDSLRGLSL